MKIMPISHHHPTASPNPNRKDHPYFPPPPMKNQHSKEPLNPKTKTPFKTPNHTLEKKLPMEPNSIHNLAYILYPTTYDSREHRSTKEGQAPD